MSTLPTDPSRPRLSIAMILRDAAPVVQDTIRSVQSIADEVIVLDTGSADATVELAAACGARVFECTWEDDFGAARNVCLEHVTGDWVLWLDAGETMTAAASQYLREFVDHDANPQKAYRIYVQLPPVRQAISGEQIGRIRLMPRNSNLLFGGNVREALEPSLQRNGLQVETLACSIQRPQRDHDPEVRSAKARRDRALAAKSIEKSGPSAPMLLAQADAHSQMEEHSQAAEHYRNAIALAERGSTDMLEAYYGLLTTMDGDPTQLDAQINVCLEALDVYPLDAQLLCAVGSYMLRQKRLDLAERSYRLAVDHGQIDPATWHLIELAEVAAVSLSLILQLQGKEDEAERILESAAERNLQSVRIHRQLIDLYIKQGKSTPALELFDRLPVDTPNREALRTALRGGLLAANKNWLAALPYLRTAHAAGCRDPLCFRWLAVTYLSTGKVSEADALLQDWHELEPDNVEIDKYRSMLSQQSGEASADFELPAQTEDAAMQRQVRIDAPDDPTPTERPPGVRKGPRGNELAGRPTSPISS